MGKKTNNTTKEALNTPFGLKVYAHGVPKSIPSSSFFESSTASDKHVLEILKFIFDPIQWGHYFHTEYQHITKRRQVMRMMVQASTIDACLRGSYYLPSGQQVKIDKSALEKSASTTKFYPSDFVYPKPKDLPQTKSTSPSSSSSLSSSSSTVSPSISLKDASALIIEGDCIEAGLWVKHYFQVNPVVLNMASRSLPGGGYRNGAGAQEESLHRRTNLFQCLEDPFHMQKRVWSYPIAEFGGIYSKDVCVIRDSEANGYAFKESPETISFVAVSAYSNPPVETVNGKTILSGKIAQHTIKKIETIFNIAVNNGHDSIILGAFGCGAYSNPAEHISLLFKQVMKQFQPYFKVIVFAIIDGKSEVNPKGNLFYFQDAFKCPVININELPV